MDSTNNTSPALTATFTKKNLYVETKAIYYVDGEGAHRFVAHCKRLPAKSMVSWMINHISPSAFFAAVSDGESMLAILEGTGYVLPHVRRWMREKGLDWKIPADVRAYWSAVA